MQLIGIYINNHNSEITKSLKENWYPFGNFSNCHGLTDFTKIKEQLDKNKALINHFYNIDQEKGKSGPTINLNCIVGKNGSGKSSLLGVVYRIINNLACKLKEVLPDYNKDYEPRWAWGIDAELYYEINNKVCCIKVFNNSEVDYKKKKKKNFPVKLIVDSRDLLIKDKSSDLTYIKNLGNYIFYSIGTNYSLYSNSTVRNEYDLLQEKWLSTLYHKNDGYFTPIVLVPYRYNSTSIDTEKELQLANERVSTLSLLLYFSPKRSSFVENLYPEKIIYSLKTKENYKKEIEYKYENLIKDIVENSGLDPQEQIYAQCTLWEKIENLWRNKYNPKGDINVYENMIQYLTYKIIKMFIYYDKYKKTYNEVNLLAYFNHSEAKCAQLFENEIDIIEKEPIDFTNLKIKQCLQFIKNESFYLDSKFSISDNKYVLPIENLEKYLKKSQKKNYDSIFVNLLPPFFNKKFYFEKKRAEDENDKDISISSMSSGEQQILYSISYAVYHMKNAANNQYSEERIPYRNINLIFDEAELYYHPEYQSKFIGKNLSILKRCHFEEDIDSINITIVTHSPFILSDIPNRNILALKEGKRETFNTSTLGANIYDLLNNQFFMESAIGSHVENAINDIIKDYYNFQETKSKKRRTEIKNKYTKSENDFNYYDELINQIGDEYLHETLFDMIDQIREIPFRERRIKEYENKIERLKNETN